MPENVQYKQKINSKIVNHENFYVFFYFVEGTREFNFSSRPTRQHWPRFSMHIEFDQKRSIWNIRVEGKLENEIQAPVHDMKKNKSGVTPLFYF